MTSFFTYGYDGSNSDEIDFEFLSSLMNDDDSYPDGDPLLTNAWNESFQNPECIAPGPDGLDLTQWNIFRIYWYPDLRRVEWTWLDPANGETVLRTKTNAFYVPDEPMALYFNFWAPPGPWPEPCDPYDPNLQPVDDVNSNQICAYEIDYVEVRAPAEEQHPCSVDEVVCQSYGDCCNPNTYCRYSPASRVLGPPNWPEYASVPGEWWKGSPGEGGEFVVKFTQVLVADGPGNDLRFWQGNGGGGETSQVQVSLDGVSFSDLCVLNDNIHSGGDPSPTSDGYYFDCDLSGTGLSAIRYVKVVDVPGDGDGSDIDAIEALSCNAIPTVSEWGLAIMTLLLLTAGTVVLIRRQPVEAQTTR